MKEAIIAHFAAMLQEEEFEQVAAQLQSLEQHYFQVSKELAEKKAAKAAALQAEASAEESAEAEETPAAAPPAPEPDAHDVQFEALRQQLKDKLKAKADAKTATQKGNLELKSGIIESIKQLIAEEENISKAFSSFKELQDEWTAAGDVPGKDYKELQSNYSQIVEQFYYNINIYKALQEHDLKRNFERKNEVITKLQQLQTVEQIKDLERQMRALMEEWDQIGPTRRELWEEVRGRYRTITSAIFDRIRKHYKSLKDQQKENLAKKTELSELVEAVKEEEFNTAKDWQTATNKVLGWQQAWKEIGFASKKDNDRIWKRFRGACDHFFERKKAYYNTLKGSQNDNRDRKKALIDKARELKDSQEWKKTSQDIINLQKAWKKVGPAQQRDEQKLWRQFREACDFFFNAKKAWYDGMDDRNAESQKVREEMIAKVTAFALTGEKEADLQALGDLGKEWEALPQASGKVRSKLNDDFSAALDKHYNAMGLGKEKASIQFKQKLDRFKHSDRSDDLLHKELQQIRDAISKLESTVIQYENNLGFFARSKGNNPFKQEVEEKIAKTKAEIDKLRQKKKLVDKELRQK